ncbi:MAG TPA: hypothetical protein VHC22_02175 [Pirellulales bacterium]|nr:hypothetical protein [Pirellulales bacterium]
MTTVDMDVRPEPFASQDVASVGRWRPRDHTIFLAVVVVMNVCLDLVALRTDVGHGTIMIWAGFLLAQTFLMGLWMAFGGLHPLLRALLVASITAGGTLAASFSTGSSFGNLAAAFLQLAPIAGTTVFATHAMLLPLRLLMSWRIDFDPAYYEVRPNLRMQFRLLDCIGLITAVALPLALGRLLDGELLKFAAIGGCSALFGSLPIAYLIVVPRRSDKTWILAALVLSVVLAAEYLAFWSVFNGETGVLLPFNLGLMATLLLNVVPLRCLFGLHLFSVAPGARRDEVHPIALRRTDTDLAALAEAWPTLPDVVRNQIVALASVASAWPSLPEAVRRQIVAAMNAGKGSDESLKQSTEPD